LPAFLTVLRAAELRTVYQPDNVRTLPYRFTGQHARREMLDLKTVQTIQDRLREAVHSLGGVRKTEARTKIGHSAISAWLAPIMKAADAKKWRGPSVSSLRHLSEQTGIATDWLLGFRVPRERASRELVTSAISLAQLRRALREHVASAIKKDETLPISNAILTELLADRQLLDDFTASTVLKALELAIDRRLKSR
jgi:hypothetical protein